MTRNYQIVTTAGKWRFFGVEYFRCENTVVPKSVVGTKKYGIME